ncbi:MAG TPA: carotenoid biosynthesis protein [Candidatus Hydrogenedentes bacterium]|nr:carotenoid biosynthesis protein [Candidatus Hydrogenedentota bacterium]HOS01490.1 carotenoid biosynthesis protein [Candidatus Hydrogenedentota bacterium]
MNARKSVLAALTACYAALWLGGAITYGRNATPPPVLAWTAPAFLATAALIVLAGAARRDAVSLLGIGALGFLAEAMGVHTGFPFGQYVYSDALFPAVWKVPVVMACAWWTLSGYVREMLRGLFARRIAEAFCAAIWMTALDFVIDPLAAGSLGYWKWAHPGVYYGIPLLNFAGWLGVSLLIFLVIPPPRRENRPARSIGLSMIVFFLFPATAHAHWGVVVAGAGLCLAHFLVCRICSPRTFFS